MQAANILEGVAIILLAAAIWDDLKQGGRGAPARRTFLLTAGIFAVVSAILRVIL